MSRSYGLCRRRHRPRNIRTPDGKPIGEQGEPYFTDDFGHPYYDGPSRYLAAQVSRRLGVRARHEKPGTIQRSMMACVSHTDVQEAGMAGKAAVRRAIAGETTIIITLEPPSPATATSAPPAQPRWKQLAARSNACPQSTSTPTTTSSRRHFSTTPAPSLATRFHATEGLFLDTRNTDL